MKYNSFFRRGVSALIALVLMVGFAVGQNNLVISSSGTITNSGTIRVKGNIDNTGVSGVTTIGGTVELKGTSGQSIGTDGNGRLNFTNLTATAVSTKTINVPTSVATALNITSIGATQFIVASNDTLFVGGTIANTGGAGSPYDFDNADAVVYYNGGAQSIWTTTYSGLTVSNAGTKTLGGSITVDSALEVINTGDLSIGANLLTVNGTYAVSGGGTVTGGASSDLTLNGTGNISSFQVTGGLSDFTVNRSGYTVTLGSDLTVADGFTLTAGTLAVSTQALTLSGAVTSTGTLTSAATGTVNYAKGTNLQTVLAANYGHLTFSNFEKTLPAGTVGIAGTFTPGSYTTHTLSNGTISFNGGNQDIPAFNGTTGYYSLVTEGADGSVKTATGATIYANTLNNGNSGADSVIFDLGANTLSVASTITNTNSLIRFGGTGLLVTTGSVAYNGSSNQTIVGGGDYYNLLISGNNTKNILTGVTVGTLNSLLIPTGTTLNLNDGSSTLNLKGFATLTVNGTLSNSGVIDVGN